MAAASPPATATRVMNSGVFRWGMTSILLGRSFRPCPTELARGGADLVAPLLVRRLEVLLLAVLAEQPGRLDAAIEAAVQLLKRLALAGMDGHAFQLSFQQMAADIVPEDGHLSTVSRTIVLAIASRTG